VPRNVIDHMAKTLVKSFIIWARKRAPRRRRITTFAGEFTFSRFEFLWPDESRRAGKHYNRPPWWRPFNVMLHCWQPKHGGEEFHSHPRWGITVCLRGKLIERTPRGEKTLTPGSVVFRSRKAIHAFRIPKGYGGKTWTLFIVGRRNHRQSVYSIKTQ
jgi:hypothetical protein